MTCHVYLSFIYFDIGLADVLSEAKEMLSNTTRRPTYIETSAGDWDAIRGDVEDRFLNGMSVRSCPLGLC